MSETINLKIKRVIFDYPEFQSKVLKLIAEIEEKLELICANCGHKRKEHEFAKNNLNLNYCRVDGCVCGGWRYIKKNEK